MRIPAQYLFHNRQSGYNRLMYQPKDLVEREFFSSQDISRANAAPVYAPLFAGYAQDMSAAVDLAGDWWVGIVDRQAARTGSLEEGLKAAGSAWPAGPSANEHVVSTVREYWLSVVDVAAGLELEQRVAPEDFLLAWIADREAIFDVLTGMPYWPIGIDEKRNWC